MQAESQLATNSVATVAPSTTKPRPHTRRSGNSRVSQKKAPSQPAASVQTATPVAELRKVARATPRFSVAQPWYRRTAVIASAMLLTCATAITVAMTSNNHGIAPVEIADDEGPLTPDRAAAIWVVENYGVVTVELESGEEKKFVAREHLPDEPFSVVEIDLWYQPIEGHELTFLGELPRLRKLDLSRTGVTDDHMSLIARATNLQKLALRGGSITVEGYKQLPIYEKMASFTASANKAFNDESLALVIEKMPNLRTMLFASTSVTDEGFSKLVPMTSLRDLRIQNTKVSDAAVAELTKQLPKCKVRR